MYKKKRLGHRLIALATAAATTLAMFAATATPAAAYWDARFVGHGGPAQFNTFRRGGRDWRFNGRRGINRRAFVGRNFVQINRFNNRRFYNGRAFGHRRGLGATEAAVLGAGIGVLGLAILNQNRAQRAPAPVIVQQPVIVPQQQNAPVFQQTIPQNVVGAQTGGQCLQVREYQTTIIVGGVTRDAYGNACLQPDGTWRQGPAVLVP